MRIISNKVHHFTKKELALEEIIILLICLLFGAAALAATALMPVQATIVNCGSQTELPARCEADRRCCALLKGQIPFHERGIKDDMPAPAGAGILLRNRQGDTGSDNSRVVE